MNRLSMAAAILFLVGAASVAYASSYYVKLPKCSQKLCRDVGCSPDVLCASGAHVKNCAEICGGK